MYNTAKSQTSGGYKGDWTQVPDFDPNNEHSQRKLVIFSKYLQRYLNVLGGKCPSIRVYDMFAGRGKYNGSPGSAVQAVDIIKEYRKHSECDVQLYLNEKDAANYSSLCRNINLQAHEKWLTCTQEDANDMVAEYLSGHDKSYRLFFLDPFGYTQISKKTVDDICNRHRSECLWFIPASSMARFVPIAHEVEGLERFMEEYGITFEAGQEENITWKWLTILKDAFDRNYPDHYVSVAKLKVAHGIYALYFITRHIRGLDKFVETVNWVAEQNQSQFELFNYPEDDDAILQFLSEEQSNNEVYKWMLKQGRAPKSARKTLMDMEEKGKINVRPTDATQQRRKGSFYLNYQHYQESPKIMIQSTHVGN